VGTASLVVTNAGKPSAAVSVPVAPFSPGIFAINNMAVAINSDGSLAAPANAIAGISTHPAKVGDAGGLIILCTGLGAVDPPVTTGDKVTDGKLHTATTTPTVMVGGKAVPVAFAGMSPQFVGVNQINISLPAGTTTGNSVPLQLQVGGVTTSAQVTIAVSQ